MHNFTLQLLLCLLLCPIPSEAAQLISRRHPPRYYSKAPPPARPPVWCLYPGKTLKNSVHSWAQKAGWTLQWQFRYDYPIVVTTCFQGSFLQAIQALTHAYDQAEHPFYLDLYPPQRLVIIGD